MKKILILGANGQIARFAIRLFVERTDFELTLYARNAARLRDIAQTSRRIHVIEGDVLNAKALEEAMAGHDIVYANLDGELVQQAKHIVRAMETTGTKRLIFISSMGIYDEVPGQAYKSILDPYRDSVAIIEKSGLEYTIIRPEWLNNRDEIDYETTNKGEPFKNPEKWLSRKSVADLVVKLTQDETRGIRQSLGINKP